MEWQCRPISRFCSSVALRKQLDVLEGARDAHAGDAVWRRMGELLALEHQSAGGRRVDAADQVEDRRLAGTVRADDGEHLTVMDVEADGFDGADAAAPVCLRKYGVLRHDRSWQSSRLPRAGFGEFPAREGVFCRHITTAVAPSISTTSTCWPGSKTRPASSERADQISPASLIRPSDAAVDPFQDDGLPALEGVDAAALSRVLPVAVGERPYEDQQRDGHHHEGDDLRDDSAAEPRGGGAGHRADREHPELGHRRDHQRDAQPHCGYQPPHPCVHEANRRANALGAAVAARSAGNGRRAVSGGRLRAAQDSGRPAAVQRSPRRSTTSGRPKQSERLREVSSVSIGPAATTLP